MMKVGERRCVWEVGEVLGRGACGEVRVANRKGEEEKKVFLSISILVCFWINFLSLSSLL